MLLKMLCKMFIPIHIQCEFKKGKPEFDSKFLKIGRQKTLTKLVSLYDSRIIIFSSGTLLIHIRPWMAAQQSILRNMSSWRCFRCMMAFAGAFTLTKQQFRHTNCIV